MQENFEVTGNEVMPWDTDLVDSLRKGGEIVPVPRSEIKQQIFTALAEGRLGDAMGRFKVWSMIGGEVLPPDEVKIAVLGEMLKIAVASNEAEAVYLQQEIVQELAHYAEAKKS
jgi:hypothetical protein